MDLRGLGAFLSAIAGYFSAQAGAKAGQLQGLLMGEELTERRKRMKMAEEAHQEEVETRRLQRRLQEAEEARRAELFPLHKGALQQQLEQEAEMFPLRRKALATQVEAGELNLQNQRLWSLFQQGVVPSQITDPVLRAQYEPFYNYQMVIRSLDAVMSNEDLEALLEQLPEDQRGAVRILGQAKLFENQTRQQLMERYLQGANLNLAQGEYQLRTAQINFAINTVLNNINAEGTNWDKRSPQQKIEAVRKWLRQVGLEEVVPPNFAEMFQRVQSADARQLALLQAQVNMQLRANMSLAQQQFGFNRSLQEQAMWGNIVSGALQAQQQGGFGGGGVAPVGFAVPPPPAVFNNAPDNRGNRLNQSLLNKYIQVPFEIPVPVRVGNQMIYQPLSGLQGEVSRIYSKLGSPNADLTLHEINTLITFDAGLYQAGTMARGMQIDWNTALQISAERVLPILKSLPHYTTNNNYRKAINDWEQAFRRRAQEQGQPVRQGQGQPAQRGAQRPTSPPTTQADIPRGRIGREP
jgi:hypothetical protein